MLESGPLTVPDAITVEVVRERGMSREGFLRVRHVELRNQYPDGSTSQPYEYFMVERTLLDAVAIVLYRETEAGPELLLRSQLRPPLAFRTHYEVPVPALGTGAVQWEIPAGLIELGERGEDGLFARASAEALEEVGYVLAPTRFSMLGAATSLSPGMIAEKLHFVCARIASDDSLQPPEGDGHAVEEHSKSRWVSLPNVQKALAEGLVHDIKTELALYRLRQRLGET